MQGEYGRWVSLAILVSGFIGAGIVYAVHVRTIQKFGRERNRLDLDVARSNEEAKRLKAELAALASGKPFVAETKPAERVWFEKKARQMSVVSPQKALMGILLLVAFLGAIAFEWMELRTQGAAGPQSEKDAQIAALRQVIAFQTQQGKDFDAHLASTTGGPYAGGPVDRDACDLASKSVRTLVANASSMDPHVESPFLGMCDAGCRVWIWDGTAHLYTPKGAQQTVSVNDLSSGRLTCPHFDIPAVAPVSATPKTN